VVSLDDKILRSFEYLSGNKLYLNLPADDGEGRKFVPSERVWFEPGDRGWGWSGLFFDYELDGDEDFYLSNGWIPRSPAADQRNQMFVRDGDTFYQTAEHGDASETFAGNSRTAVSFDMDNDGDLDLAVNNYAQPPKLLENKQSRGNAWLKLELAGKGGNTRAVGAIVELQASGKTQRRVVTCGDGYLGQEDETVHFGLGAAKEATVTVTWPDGTKTPLGALAAGKVHAVSQ
jgi:enediyne biosynthesis protein E4